MTKEEAIEMLVNATYSDEWQGNEKLTTAHLMAIEALKQVTGKLKKPMILYLQPTPKPVRNRKAS